MEAPLFIKLEYFSKLSNKNSQCLRELFLFFELQIGKAEDYLPALTFLVTLQGISSHLVYKKN